MERSGFPTGTDESSDKKKEKDLSNKTDPISSSTFNKENLFRETKGKEEAEDKERDTGKEGDTEETEAEVVTPGCILACFKRSPLFKAGPSFLAHCSRAQRPQIPGLVVVVGHGQRR